MHGPQNVKKNGRLL